MTDILKILLGGLLTGLGGFIVIWSQAKMSRKIRMDEVIAEKKVTANAEAYEKMKYIATWLMNSKFWAVFGFILENEKWFFKNRLFLPGIFPNKWITIRNYVKEALELEKQPGKANKLKSLKKELIKTANEANLIIYKEMALEKIEVQELQY